MAFKNIKIVGNGAAQIVLTNTAILEGVTTGLVAYNSTAGALSFSLLIDGVSIITESVDANSSYRLPDKINIPSGTELTLNAPVGLEVTLSAYQATIDSSAALSSAQGSAAAAAQSAIDATTNGNVQVGLAADQATLATNNGAVQVSLAADQVVLAAQSAVDAANALPAGTLDDVTPASDRAYSSSKIQTSLDLKADQETTYTKTETDAKVVELSPPATKAHVDSLGINAATLTGILPAIDGSNLTNIDAVEVGTTLPSPASDEGSLFYTSGDDQFYISDGTVWTSLTNVGPSSTGGTVVIPSVVELSGSYSYNIGINFVDDHNLDSELTYGLELGTLPPGCTVPTSGNTLLTGTIGAVSTDTLYNFTISAMDTFGATSTQNYQWLVSNQVPVATGGTVAIAGITESAAGSYDVDIDFTYSAGAVFSAYSLLSGTLPTGISLNTSTGVISGITGGSGSFSFTIRGTTVDGTTADQAYSWIIDNVVPTATGGTVAIAGADSGVAVSYDVDANFTFATGSAFSAFNLQSGTLPTGISLNTSTGVISGTTPNSPTDTYSFTIRATDTDGDVVDQNYSWTITLNIAGQSEYTSEGTYSWTAPAEVTSVSAVAIGAGGSSYNSTIQTQSCGGGALAYLNNFTVVPGNSYSVVVGSGHNSGDGGYSGVFGMVAGGGKHRYEALAQGGQVSGLYTGGSSGGAGGAATTSHSEPVGGGGAGGYSGAGGAGGASSSVGSAGSGGSAGGGAGAPGGSGSGGGAGGGVEIYGQTSSGAGGVLGSGGQNGGGGGGGGSGGGNGGKGCPDSGNETSISNGSGRGAGIHGGGATGGAPGSGGGGFGGGAGSAYRNYNNTTQGGTGGAGAVRIIWGNNRNYPSTNTADQ